MTSDQAPASASAEVTNEPDEQVEVPGEVVTHHVIDITHHDCCFQGPRRQAQPPQEGRIYQVVVGLIVVACVLLLGAILGAAWADSRNDAVGSSEVTQSFDNYESHVNFDIQAADRDYHKLEGEHQIDLIPAIDGNGVAGFTTMRCVKLGGLIPALNEPYWGAFDDWAANWMAANSGVVKDIVPEVEYSGTFLGNRFVVDSMVTLTVLFNDGLPPNDATQQLIGELVHGLEAQVLDCRTFGDTHQVGG